MIKGPILYGHPPNPKMFEQYYMETHLPFGGKMKGGLRIELMRFEPGPDSAEPAHYRMAAFYFPDKEKLQATFESSEGDAAVADFGNSRRVV